MAMESRETLESAGPALWQEAFDALSDVDKKQLRFANNNAEIRPSDIIRDMKNKKNECAQSKWTFYINREGNKVSLPNVLDEAIDWLDRIDHMGVQFNRGLAVIIFPAISALVQMVFDDCHIFGAIVESLEGVLSTITRYAELERRILMPDFDFQSQLHGALVNLYRATLQFLADTCRYYDPSAFGRGFDLTISSKILINKPMSQIGKRENEVYQLVCAVQETKPEAGLDDILACIKQRIEDIHAYNKKRCAKLASWVNGIDTKNSYETSLRYHHPGTCEWVLELPQFLSWESDETTEPKLLWIHGPAGSGKSIMSAWMIRHLEQKSQAPLSYFFCTADDQLTRDPYAILRSWLTQMIEADETLFEALDRTHDASNREQSLTPSELWEAFVAVGNAVDGCTFVVDGFDECVEFNTGFRYHRNESRGLFLHDLLENLSKTRSRVLIVSRDLPDIREYLGPVSAADHYGVDMVEHTITAGDTAADIRLLSEHIVNAELPNKNSQLRQEIAMRAAERSGGVFLWIKLLEQEISPGQNAKQLRRTVMEMPSALEDIYSQELEKMARLQPKHRENAAMVLRWTLLAARPLQVKQLVEALVVSADSLSVYPEDELPDCWHDGFVDEDYVIETILSRCGSLLQLRSSSTDMRLAEHTVHFVHSSMKEFISGLCNTVSSRNWATELGLSDIRSEERRLSDICLRYLMHYTFKPIPTRLDIYPFLSYAGWAWYLHTFNQRPASSKDVIRRAQRAFDHATRTWRVRMPLVKAGLTVSGMDDWDFGVISASETESDTGSEHSQVPSTPGPRSPLYYASLFGVIDVVKWLEDQDLNHECVGGLFGFPLQAAAVRGHEAVVRYLLDRRADASQKGGQWNTAIVAATAVSNLGTVQMLLAANADVEEVDKDGLKPLHHAAKWGNVEIIRALLDNGAEINAATKRGETAVYFACSIGHKDAVSFLADRGAKLGSSGTKSSKSLLQEAIGKGNYYIATLLLDLGASPNEQFPHGSRPLHSAVKWPTMLQLLISRGADPNLLDKENWTPLHRAVFCRNLAAMTLLMDAGASVHTEQSIERGRCSLLQAAAAKGRVDIMKLLCSRGANINQKVQDGDTALLVAARWGRPIAVEWLLEAGASMRCIEEHLQQSAFDIVADSGLFNIATLLVRRGCFRVQCQGQDAEAPDLALEWPNDSLVMLSYSGKVAGVKSCLMRCEGDISSDTIGEALNVSSAMGHLEIVKTLLAQGIDIDARDVNGRTALHHAITRKHYHVANLLVQMGASVSIEDAIGSTSIDLAVRNGTASALFIKNHLNIFAANSSGKPSPMVPAENQTADSNAAKTRNALSGFWTGHYAYLAWEEGRKDSFSIDIPTNPPENTPENTQQITFSSKNEDAAGSFQIHGSADFDGNIRFIKLYNGHGWLYYGRLDVEKGVMKGTWGGNRKLVYGTFELRREG